MPERLEGVKACHPTRSREGWQGTSYGQPWAMANHTMALARMRLTRVRTRSQPCMLALFIQ